MADKTFLGNIAEIISVARSYVDARIELWKISLLEKASLAGAFFLGSVIIILIIAFCLLFVSLAFSYWYGQRTGDLALGFLITAGFYVVLGLIFILIRKYIIIGPVIKRLSSIIYKDDEPSDQANYE